MERADILISNKQETLESYVQSLIEHYGKCVRMTYEQFFEKQYSEIQDDVKLIILQDITEFGIRRRYDEVTYGFVSQNNQVIQPHFVFIPVQSEEELVLNTDFDHCTILELIEA